MVRGPRGFIARTEIGAGEMFAGVMDEQRVRRGEQRGSLEHADIAEAGTKQLVGEQSLVIRNIRVIGIGDDRIRSRGSQESTKARRADANQNDLALRSLERFANGDQVTNKLLDLGAVVSGVEVR